MEEGSERGERREGDKNDLRKIKINKLGANFILTW